MDDENKNFIRDYLNKNNGKIDSNFINQYLATVAIIEYFISRAYPEIKDEKISNIQNAYMEGIENQDVSDCDFSSLTQEEFEMLRFNEGTKFNKETIDRFHPSEILKRENTQIKATTDNKNMTHVAILDGPIVNANDDSNSIVKNYVDESIQVRDSYHGRSVYSIFRSINPNCVVHFYGTSPMYGEKSTEDITNDRLKALQDIIEYNNNCTDDSKKIKLISCSHRISPKEKEMIEGNQINVISAENLDGDFFEYFKFDDKDVTPSLTEEERKYLQEKYSKYPNVVKLIERMDSFVDNAILMNTNLVIDQHYGNMKRHECDIAVSWGVPVVAAYYAMALRENPNMSYEDFYGICKKSLKEKTNIFDEKLFMENVKEIKQEKAIFSEQEIGKYTVNTPTLTKKQAKHQIQEDISKYTEKVNEQTNESERG